MKNGRSETRIFFSNNSLNLVFVRDIAPEDEEVFERYLSEVKVVSKSRDGLN